MAHSLKRKKRNFSYAYFHFERPCRVCRKSDFVKILDLGKMPLANGFLKKESLGKPELKFPLSVYLCRNCLLLQLRHIVNPVLLFRNYYYLTSTSKPLAGHFKELGRNLVERFNLDRKDLFVDIGGNDAVLLESIKDKVRVLNIEPAKNIAKISESKGVETISDFFGKKLALKIRKKYGLPKIITASNVVAHINNLEDFFEGIKILLEGDGVFLFEVHWAANLLGLAGVGGFDQIYHEHLSYFSLLSLERLISRIGLKIYDVKKIPIHGCSLRVCVSKNRESLRSVREFLQQEKDLGLSKIETFIKFKGEIEKNKKELKSLLQRLRKEGKKIVGYGAPAKGNVLMGYFGIDNKILEYVVDDSPLKQGLFTPGNHLPIFSPAVLRGNPPDYLLLLAWNYADSILKKERELRDAGVKFIIPVPKVKII